MPMGRIHDPMFTIPCFNVFCAPKKAQHRLLLSRGFQGRQDSAEVEMGAGKGW